MEAVIEGNLNEELVKWRDEAAVCVVLASGGYPETAEKGKVIQGLEIAAQNALVFHAGTKMDKGNILTDGGRVVGISALGNDIKSAIDKAYQAVDKVYFENMHFRKDIGQKALNAQELEG